MERENAVELIKQILLQTNRVFSYSIVVMPPKTENMQSRIGVFIDLKNNDILLNAILDVAKRNGLATEEGNDVITIY